MRILIGLAALAAAACTPAPAGTAASPETATPAATYASVKALQDALDWQHGKGPDLQVEYDAAVKKLLVGQPRPDVIKQVNDAGYECTYGEAHQDYPDPMAVCTRSFATRACQMDWEIASTADKGKADEAVATFTRDCVGTVDDWPEPKESEIDNQLAPQAPPAPPN